jgi:Ni,Fe-hydrogenase III large subunit/Ni,Fe-hydrogenase III component G
MEVRPIPGAVPAWQGDLDRFQLPMLCSRIKAGGGRLVALWGSDERDHGTGFVLHVALTIRPGLVVLRLPLDAGQPVFPDLSVLFPAGNRIQRAAHDLLGIRPENGPDLRPWLRHGTWPAQVFPLRKDFDTAVLFPPEPDRYPFVVVSGEGVHEIAVGPVHAGIIEPGHFRFQVVGEKMMRLEERLGYKHKGIEKRFEGMTLMEGARLAGRVSGDSTVAYAWAYAMAVEGATRTTPPERALWLRALLLERERIMNHLGDLGALGNDAGFALGLAQFSRLKEDVLRSNRALFDHRYLMDVILPGGVARDLESSGVERIHRELDDLEKEVTLLKNIYDEHSGLQDRFLETGTVSLHLAEHLGLTGMAGRASGQPCDQRVQYPYAPYDRLEVRMTTHSHGDVAARVAVRFDEMMESFRLIRQILDRLPGGGVQTTLSNAPDGAFGLGWVEGWRGEVLIGLHCGVDNRIRRLHPHDPSWQNWPVLEHAVHENIVPDFPLINKSFNLSYSGHDL